MLESVWVMEKKEVCGKQEYGLILRYFSLIFSTSYLKKNVIICPYSFSALRVEAKT